MLSNANAKESQRTQKNSGEWAFGNKTDRKKVFTRAAAAMPAAKNHEWHKFPSLIIFPI